MDKVSERLEAAIADCEDGFIEPDALLPLLREAAAIVRAWEGAKVYHTLESHEADDVTFGQESQFRPGKGDDRLAFRYIVRNYYVIPEAGR